VRRFVGAMVRRFNGSMMFFAPLRLCDYFTPKSPGGDFASASHLFIFRVKSINRKARKGFTQSTQSCSFTMHDSIHSLLASEPILLRNFLPLPGGGAEAFERWKGG